MQSTASISDQDREDQPYGDKGAQQAPRHPALGEALASAAARTLAEVDRAREEALAIARGAAHEVLPLPRIAAALIARLKSTAGATIHRI